MLTFFRINSIFQFIMLVVLFFIIRFIFLLNDIPLLNQEMENILIGQKLSEGFSLYSDILVNTAPLTSYFYWFTYNIFRDNFFAYEILAAILVLIQAIQFNTLVNRRSLYNEANYLPGLFYILLMSLSFDLMKLTPPLLSNTFILLGINSILKQMGKTEGFRDDVFEGSLFLGIATLFHHQAFVFIIWALVVLWLYTSMNFRQTLMVILGWIMPIFLMYLFYYFNGTDHAFVDIWLFNFNSYVKLSWLNIRDILISFTLPIIVSLFGIYSIFREFRYNSFQNRSHQAILIFGIFAVISFLLSGKYIPSNLLYFITPLAFFIGAFFIHYRNVWIPEVIFIVFSIIILTISYIGANPLYGFSTNQLADYRMNLDQKEEKYTNKYIFITGGAMAEYKDNYIASGYIDWNLAKNDFNDINNYLSVANINKNLTRNLPEIIIDHEEVMPEVFNKIPALKEKYKKTKKNVYELKR